MDNISQLAMNRVAIAGTATRDCEVREGNSRYAFFLLMHNETGADGKERRLLVGVYCPTSLVERASHVRRGDNVFVTGSLRILPENDEARVEIHATHLGKIANG